MTSSDRLRDAIGRLTGTSHRPTTPLTETPISGWDIQVKQRLIEIDRELTEIRNRTNTLFWAIIAAVLINVIVELVK